MLLYRYIAVNERQSSSIKFAVTNTVYVIDSSVAGQRNVFYP